MSRISSTPCPRCGCHLVEHFRCNCGACDTDYCVNCGRYTMLDQNAFTELSPFDVVCAVGPVAHEHSQKEKFDRLGQYIKGQL